MNTSSIAAHHWSFHWKNWTHPVLTVLPPSSLLVALPHLILSCPLCHPYFVSVAFYSVCMMIVGGWLTVRASAHCLMTVAVAFWTVVLCFLSSVLEPETGLIFSPPWIWKREPPEGSCSCRESIVCPSTQQRLLERSSRDHYDVICWPRCCLEWIEVSQVHLQTSSTC